MSNGALIGSNNQQIFYTGMGNRVAQQSRSNKQQLSENLTPMERKILKKLKETARGKTGGTQPQPVKLSSASS